MFYRIIGLIVDVAGGLLVGACLLRLWMQQMRINVRNPVGTFVMALSDWIVKPLRRLLPGYGGIDWASLVAAFLLSLAAALIMLIAARVVLGSPGLPGLFLIVGLAFAWTIKWALYMIQLVVLIAAVLSWINPFSPFLPVFDALTVPLLRPLRRVLPPVGRVDLSPLALIVLIQIALLVLATMSQNVLGIF